MTSTDIVDLDDVSGKVVALIDGPDPPPCDGVHAAAASSGARHHLVKDERRDEQSIVMWLENSQEEAEPEFMRA